MTSLERPGAPSQVVTPSTTLEELFESQGAYVWNTLRRLGVPPPDVEDLTHDLFLEVRRHLGDYEPSRPVRPWLFGFAFRIASHHRRRAYRRHEGSDQGLYSLADGAAPADEEIATRQRRELVLRALESVELDRRAVLILHDIDGEPMIEVGRVLGIPVNTAYSRLRVARTDLAAAVKRLMRREGEA